MLDIISIVIVCITVAVYVWRKEIKDWYDGFEFEQNKSEMINFISGIILAIEGAMLVTVYSSRVQAISACKDIIIPPALPYLMQGSMLLLFISILYSSGTKMLGKEYKSWGILSIILFVIGISFFIISLLIITDLVSPVTTTADKILVKIC